jgi:hypothetical protein
MLLNPMKFKTLNGREITQEVSQQRYPQRTRENCRSQGQFHLGQQLRVLYKTAVILEEFTIPGSKLSLDFYIPSFRVAFEFQGEQHDQFNAFFHRDKNDFVKQSQRDQNKKDWCKLNSIKLIEIRESAITQEQLVKTILESING